MNTIVILFLVILYHFLYRIFIGELVSAIDLKKDINYNSLLLHEFGFEKKLYDVLKVKYWKNHMVTAKPYKFNIYDKPFAEVLKSMIVAEKVHVICFFLSYLPILLTFKHSTATASMTVSAIMLTSFIASLIDLSYVIIQRYNIPRLLKLMTFCHN